MLKRSAVPMFLPVGLDTLLVRCSAVLMVAAVLTTGGSSVAQPPVGNVTNIPAPDDSAKAFETSLRYDAGNLYAWNGLGVWVQSGGTGNFNFIGSATAGNQADAGPICFSQDGQTLLLSNGAGGTKKTGNGGFFTMPVSGGMAAQVAGSVSYTFDALALPTASTIPGSSTKYVVNEGDRSYATSSLSIFDAATGADRVVVDSGPGATTSIAINPQTHGVYAGVGYGPDAGKIYSFSLSQIDSAYASAPIHFTSGTLFNPAATGSQSGSGMFFDNNGYLFSGGDGVTVFRPNGSICYDQPAGAADGYYDTLSFNPTTNEVLKVPFGSSTGILYNAADFEPAYWTKADGGSWGLGSNWSGRPSTTAAALVFAGSTSGTATVALDGDRSAPGGLQFGDGSTAGAYAITAGGTDTLTLGTTANGASIAVVDGTQSIAVPIVLEGNLSVSVSAGTRLVLSGSVNQDAGVSAAITLSGDGSLVLSGTNSFSGGVTVIGGTMELLTPYALPDGESLTVGDSAAFAGAPVSESVVSHGVTAIPEPRGLAILLAAGTGVFAFRRRFRLASLRRFA